MSESNPTQVILTDDGLKIIKAQSTADNAKDLAGTADNNIKNINDPNYLSPVEKPQLEIQMDNFATIYSADKNIATAEGIDFAAYDAAYQAYVAYMTPLVADMTTYSPIVRSTFNSMVTAVQAEQKHFNAATQAQYNQQINKAQTDIANGQTKYEALQSDAETMKSSVAGIADAADRAISSAGFASNAASAASQAASSAVASALGAESNASSAVSIANSTASAFGPVSQKADSAFSNAMSAESSASSAVSQASSAAADSKDAKQIAGAVSQSYKTLTDGSTMTIAELESGLAVKLTKKDLDGYATQDWAQNQIKTTADGINGTLSKKIEKTDLNGYATEDWSNNQIKITADGINGTISSVKNTVDSQTTSINTLQTDSNGFKGQFTKVNNTLGKQTTDIGTLQTDSSGFKTQFTTVNDTLGKHTTDIGSLQVTAKGLQSTVSDKVSSDQLTQLSNQLTNKISDLSSSTSSQFTQTASDINGLVKKGDVVNQFNLDAGGALLSTSGNSTKIVFSSPNIIFDSKNPVQIPNANIPGTLTGKTFEAGTITATTNIKGADIEAPIIHSPNGSFNLDGNTGDIIGASIHSADNSWEISKDGIINGSTLNGATINTPNLDLGMNGTFTEDFDYTQDTSLFLPKKNKGTLTFNHGVLQSKGNMQTYLNGQWGGMNDGRAFQSGMNNSQWTEIAPGYIKLDLFKQNGTDVAERTYTDPTGYYYSLGGNGATSYLGNVLQTPQVQTAGVLTQYIGPSRGALRLQIGQNGKDSGLQVGSYGGNEAVLSDFIYNFTASTSSNVFITSNGHLGRSTSASKYKYNIKNPDIETTLGDRLLNVHMATWNDKRAVDSYAEQLNTGEEREKSSIDKYYGLIAEQLRDAGLDMFISYGKNHEIEGVQYDRAWIPLLSVIRRLNNKVNEYELRISKLEGKINE